jgi:RNA polymerase sigma-70 factor (ECF subfamily)
MSRDLDEWFLREILAHESALTGYLNRAWRTRAEVSDLRQETYARVYASAARGLPRSPKSFLFATARNLITDKLRRARVVSIDYTEDVDLPTFPVDELTPERCLNSQDELLLLTRAFDRLPELTRTVIWMLRVEGYSQREAAQHLGIEEGALEGRMTRGLRQLARDMSLPDGGSAFPDRYVSGTDADIGSMPLVPRRRRAR